MQTSFTFLDDAGVYRTFAPATIAAKVGTVAERLRREFEAGATVGLLFRSEPMLVVSWLAAVQAGLRPLVMQYPTKKQSRVYWLDSVSNTIGRVALAGMVCDRACGALGLEAFGPVVVLPPVDEVEDSSDLTADDLIPDAFNIVQLSSGTTGHRKAVEFRSDALLRHVRDFNEVLRLEPGRDVVVSWLPLYHDMGYVACFVMPLLLGIDVVMMDPITWVQEPTLLFDAIERHGGTIAYLPNFGFEVLARQQCRPLPTIRRWVSCSEPVSPATSRKFLTAVGADERTFSACYAMAENIFAVTISEGVQTRAIDGREVISCGRAIPGVELKTVDEEIWVKSPTSLDAYIGGDDIRDADGFYPTGDLGLIEDGALYVYGRKQDLLIQAGRKFMLSDVDLVVNELRPDAKGRAATVMIRDDRLGTEMPVVLLESELFFTRDDGGDLERALVDRLGLDQIKVEFVPPRFLTKTSSGKFNRKKSAADWLVAKEHQAAARPDRGDPVEEIKGAFATADWNAPVGKSLDSLSLTVLRIILNGTDVPYDRDKSLSDLSAALATRRPPVEAAEDAAAEGIRIVSLADHATFSGLGQKHMDVLSERLGVPVSWEHICLPPSPVILSDLVFHDWFQPRLEDQQRFRTVGQSMAKLKDASLIVLDDRADVYFALRQVYAVLSHALERDPRADEVVFRWQRYAQQHDVLPLTVVAGADLPVADRNKVHDLLSRYLGVPLFRVANDPAAARFTEGWEYRPLGTQSPPRLPTRVRTDRLVDALADWIRGRPPLRLVPGLGRPTIDTSDLNHYCSARIDREKVDKVIDHYQRFVIAGQAASAPYIRRRLDEAGKPYRHVRSYAPTVLDPIADEFDCLIVAGSMGKSDVSKPAFAVMNPGRTLPAPPPLAGTRPDANRGWKEAVDQPESSADWFYPFTTGRTFDKAGMAAYRAASARQSKAHRTALARSRARAAELMASETIDYQTALKRARKELRQAEARAARQAQRTGQARTTEG